MTLSGNICTAAVKKKKTFFFKETAVVCYENMTRFTFIILALHSVIVTTNIPTLYSAVY